MDPAQLEKVRSTLAAKRYELGGRIGQGGIGMVFAGRHRLLDRRVAIKLLDSVDERIRDLFFAEGRALAKLRHPNLVEIYDLDVVDETPYLVMELLRGETLEKRLARSGRLPFEDAVAILRQVLRGLGAAHAKGVVHRDVKPGNIFLVERASAAASVKLLDFGVAGIAGGEGEVIGTGSYFAPEQTRGETVDVRTDLWAVGVTLYQMITGSLPFAADDLEALFSRIRKDLHTPPSHLVPGLAPEIDSLVARLLDKSPDARPRTASEVELELAAAASAHKVSTRPPRPSSAPPGNEAYALVAVPSRSRATIMRAAVEDLGLLCVVVEDGAEAAAFVKDAGAPRLAIVDLNLPRESGFDLIRAIRAASDGETSKILVLSLIAGLTDALAAESSVVDEVLETWSPLELRRAAERTLGGNGLGDRGARPPLKRADPERLRAVRALGGFDENPADDESLQELLREIAHAFDVPVAMISFVLADRQLFRAHVSPTGEVLSNRSAPIEQTFCRHVVDSGEPLIVTDAHAHPAFRRHPLVQRGIVGSYLGAPVSTEDGSVVGTLCIVDHAPHAFGPRDVEDLVVLARRVAAELALQANAPLSAPKAAMLEVDADRYVMSVNAEFTALFGVTPAAATGKTRDELLRTISGFFTDPEEFLVRTRVGLGPFLACGEFERADTATKVRWLAKPVNLGTGSYRTEEHFLVL